MSGGLFGKTSYYPITENYQGSLSDINGYSINKSINDINYEKTKNDNDKFGYLLQPNYVFKENPLNKFTDNQVANNLHSQYALNASYYNGLIGKVDDFVYKRTIYIPKAFPNHFYNPQINAPVLKALSNPSYPI